MTISQVLNRLSTLFAKKIKSFLASAFFIALVVAFVSHYYEMKILEMQVELDRRVASIEGLDETKRNFMEEFRAFSQPILDANRISPAARESVIKVLIVQLNISESMAISFEPNSNERELVKAYILSIDDVRKSLEGVKNRAELGVIYEKISKMFEAHQNLVIAVKKSPLESIGFISRYSAFA